MKKLLAAGFCVLLGSLIMGADSELESAMEDIQSELNGVMEELHSLRERLHRERPGSQFGTAFLHQSNDRASLGVYLREYGDQIVVTGFPPDSAAQKSGIQQGDQILAVDDNEFTENQAKVELLVEYLQSLEPGAEVSVKVNRDKISMEFAVETQPMHEMFGTHEFEVLAERFTPWLRDRVIPRGEIHIDRFPGWESVLEMRGQDPVQVADLNPDLAENFEVDSGVLVLNAAEESELKAGDVITHVGNTEVASVEELFDALRTEHDNVVINRRGAELELDFDETLNGLQLEREVSVFSKKSTKRRDRQSW